MDTDTELNIVNNQATQNITGNEVIDINKNQDKLDYPPEVYYGNTELYLQAKKAGKINVHKFDADYFRGTAKALANSRYYAVYRDYQEELLKKEEAVAQKEFDESSWWNRTATAYKLSSLGMDRGLLYKELMEAREKGDTINAAGIQYRINKIEQEMAQYRQESDPGSASGVGALTASMFEFAPQLIGEAIVMGALGSLTGLSGGATGALAAARGVSAAKKIKKMYDLARAGIRGSLIYNHTANIEAGSTYADLSQKYPDMSEERKQDIAMTVGRLNGFIEAAGFTAGTGQLIGSIKKGIVSKLAKGEITKEIVDNPLFINRVVELVKATALESGAETAEEIVQNAVNRTVDEALEEEQKSGVEANIGFFNTLWQAEKRSGKSLLNILSSSELSEEDKETLSTIKTVLPASLLLGGGASAGSLALEKGIDHFKAKQAKKSAGERLAEGDLNLAKAEGYMEQKKNSELYKKSPEIYNEHTKNMVDEGTAPEYVSFDADVAVQLMEQAQNDENLAAQVALMDLASKIEEAQQTDGQVRIKFEDADQIIFNPENDVLFQKIKGNLTFDDTMMSSESAKQFAQTLLSQNEKLAESFSKTEGLMRNVYNQLKQEKPEEEALAQATVLQYVLNSIRTFGKKAISEEELLKNIGLKIQINRAENVAKPQTTKKFLRGEKIGERKVKTKNVDLSKVKADELKGVDVPFVEESIQGNLMFEDKDGNLTPVGNEAQFAAGKLAGQEGKVKAVVISEKDGYTLEDAKEIAKEAAQPKQLELLFQELGEDVAGYFDMSDATNQILALTKKSNPTTFGHEAFHLFFENLLYMYNKGELNEYWEKQLFRCAEWVGAKQVDGKYVFTTNNKEKLSDGFMDYLLKGKAPVKRLNVLFDFFRQLFAGVYKMLRRKPFRLSKNITKVYDSVFTTNEEVINLQKEEGWGAFEKPEGMSDEDYEGYRSLVRQATGESVNTSLNYADAIAEKRTTQAYKDKVKEYYDEFLPQVQADLKHQAFDFVARNKIDAGMLEAILPEGVGLRNDLITKGGKDPVSVAKQHGFEDVVDMVEFLNTAMSTEDTAMEAAETAADNWLRKEYPELTQVDVKNSSRNVAAIKAQISESMMLRGIPLNQLPMYYNEMVRSVEKVISNMKVSELTNVEKLLERLNVITDKYRIAENKGDKKAMSKLKYRAATLNYLIMRANMIRKDGKIFDRHFSKFKKRPTGFQLKYMSGTSWDMITAVLYKFNYTGKQPANSENITKRVVDYADKIGQEGFGMPDTLRNVALFLDNRNDVQPKNMTVADFYTLNGALRMLEAAGKQEKFFTKQQEEIFYQDMAKETLEHGQKIKWKPFEENDLLKKATLGFTVMPEIWLKKILPAKVYETLVLPFMNGFQKARRWQDEKTKRLKEIREPIEKYDNQIFTIDGRNYTGQQLSVIMCHMGNSDNKAKLLKSIQTQLDPKFNEVDLESLKNKMPKMYRAYAQAIWDSFEETVHQFADAQREITGAEIKLVEAEPVEFEDGEVLKGGYYPAPKKNLGYSKNFMESQTFETEGVFPTYSFQKERELKVHGELDLNSIAPLQSYVTKVSMVIHVGKNFDNLRNFIKRPEIRQYIGAEGIKTLADWMSLAIKPDHVNRCIAWWDNIQSVAILGASPVKAVIQMCGFIPAIARVGLPYMLQSLSRNLNPYHLLEMDKIAKQKSVYMRNRFENPENHIADVRALNGLSLKKADSFLASASQLAMLFVEMGDRFASIITWEAEYNKAIAEGKSEQTAVLRADSAVRTTQGDTSAGSRPRVLQGNLRYLTKFASYFIAIHSHLAADAFTGDWYSMAKMFILAGLVSASAEVVFSAWWRWYTADDDEKKKWKKKGINSITDYMISNSFENSVSTSASIMLPHFGIGGGLSTYALDNKEFAPQVQALTAMFETAMIPIDLAKLPLTDDQKERQKLLKRLRKHAFAPLPIKEKRFMSAWDYISERF